MIHPHPACLALAALAVLLALPGAALAQQPARDLLSFKATVTGTATVVPIPTDPPILAATMVLKGASELLGGEVTLTDSHRIHLGFDGTPLKAVDGIGVFTGPDGSALFVQWDSGPRVPDANTAPDTFQGIVGFTVTGGRGRFAGAAGSGICRANVNFTRGEITQAWEGTIAVPRK
jgi:hypothetical protein